MVEMNRSEQATEFVTNLTTRIIGFMSAVKTLDYE